MFLKHGYVAFQIGVVLTKCDINPTFHYQYVEKSGTKLRI